MERWIISIKMNLQTLKAEYSNLVSLSIRFIRIQKLKSIQYTLFSFLEGRKYFIFYFKDLLVGPYSI